MNANQTDGVNTMIEGKVVCVVFANKPISDGVYINNATVVNQAGRMFLIDEFVAPQTRMHGLPYAIAWDRIDAYSLAPSVDVYRKANKEIKDMHDDQKQ